MLKYEYHKLKCPICGRKILVEIGLTGTSHNILVNATCAHCLKNTGLPEEFKKKHANASADIEKWLKEE